MEGQRTSLRFGIMVDDLSLEAWKVETIKKLVEGGMTLAMVIRNDEKNVYQGLFAKLKNYPYRRMFFQVWNHYQFKPESKRMTLLAPALESIGVKLDEIPQIACEPQQKGTSTFILDKDIEQIKNQHLDFILRFGFNIIRGEILNTAEYGIWSFHHDDEMEYRGGPPGFWEWMNDNPRNGIVLQRLTNSLDKGYVLKKRWYPTILHSYKAHLDQLYFESSEMPLQVCREILHNGVLKEQLSESTAMVFHAPTNAKMLKYWVNCITRRIQFHLHDLFRQEDWDVGYVEVPFEQFIDSPEEYDCEIKWFRRKRRSEYYADPFVITTKKDTYIFFENYDYRKGKGCIEVARKSEEFKKYHRVLTEPYHLSYPFVFEYDGTVYCLPEGHESNRLSLYRFNEKALQLDQDCVLMEPIRAIDPTLLYLDGRWNLFLTQKDFPSVKLYRYISEDLRGPYEPFYANPVKVDCAEARMAGCFFNLEGCWFRPAQNCERYYGTGVYLERIMDISDDCYEEISVDGIEPYKNSCFKEGLHTINGNEELTVFDGKRWEFTLPGFFHQLRNKIQRRRRRHV